MPEPVVHCPSNIIIHLQRALDRMGDKRRAPKIVVLLIHDATMPSPIALYAMSVTSCRDEFNYHSHLFYYVSTLLRCIKNVSPPRVGE